MIRTHVAPAIFASIVAMAFGCSHKTAPSSTAETTAACENGGKDGDEAGVDCGGSCTRACRADGSTDGRTDPSTSTASTPGVNGVKDGAETDVDCGGPAAPKCGEGKSCSADSDCEVACNYAGKCVSAPSCKPHLGGDTCGDGEVGEPTSKHESCCRSLPVAGYTDPLHADKTVYLDKYEITAGRIRSWIEQLTAANGGRPNVKAWIGAHRPEIWNDAWTEFLPSDYDGGSKVIARRLLGDPRPEDTGEAPGTGVVLPPDKDQPRNLGINYQFGSEVYVDLHGSNCGTWDGSYGFPTYYYPPDILARDTELPRPDGRTTSGNVIPAKDQLDVKSMNCITNAMLAAFCAWDGGQLATDEVLDYVTATPATLENVSGCGTQYDDHGELLDNKFDHTVQTGGRCADVKVVNATFDAGDNLPEPGSPLNNHIYHYPDLGNVTHDKSWEIAAPGRTFDDVMRINPKDEPWMDIHGNLNEAALDMSGATFTGFFALKYRGIAYGSSRSDLNTTLMKGETVLRLQRPEAKAAFTGGRCMRFR